MPLDPSASVDLTAEPDLDDRHAVSFPLARRGYDPHQVDHVIHELTAEVEGLRATVVELREREADLLVALDAADDRTRAIELRNEQLEAELVAARAELEAADRVAVAADEVARNDASARERAGDVAPVRLDADPSTTAAAPDVATMVGAETVRIVEAARHAAVEISARAREDGERLIAEAREEARLIRADAEVQLLNRTREADDAVAARLLEAADAVQEAQARADAIVADAFTEGATAVLRAREEADAIVLAGEQRARELVDAATAVRDDLLGDLVRRRKLLRRQVEQLEAGRVRLRAAFAHVEATLGETTSELDQAPIEARDAALAAAERSESMPDEELAAVVADQVGDPALVIGRDPDTAGPAPSRDPESSEAAATAAVGPAPGEPDPSEAPEPSLPVGRTGPSDRASTAAGPEADPSGAPDPSAATLRSAPSDPPAAPDRLAGDGVSVAVEPDPQRAGDATPASPPSGPAESGPVEDQPREPASATAAVPEADATSAAEADASGPESPSSVAPAPAAAPSGRVPTPAPSPMPAPSSSSPSSGRRRRRRAPDPVEFEGRWSSAVRVLPPGADTSAEVVDDASGSGGSRRARSTRSASEVFARLRADEAHQPSLFDDDLPPMPDEGPVDGAEASADLEAAWVERRDAAFAPALRALRRRLKATLADDEDALLEALRRTEPLPTSIESLRDAAGRRDDLAIAFGPSLATAAAAGSELAAAAAGSSTTPIADAAASPAGRTTAGPADLAPIAHQLADEVVGPLDERLERSLARYHRTLAESEDPEAAAATLVSSVKAAYRARRGVQVQVPTEDAVLRAGHRGLLAALEPGTPLRWVVAPPAGGPRRGADASGDDPAPGGPSSCPSCVAVADVGAGDGFGHGPVLPPARPGCRCAIAPVVAVVPRRP